MLKIGEFSKRSLTQNKPPGIEPIDVNNIQEDKK